MGTIEACRKATMVRVEARKRRVEEVYQYALKHDTISVKEVAVEFKWDATTASSYIRELVDQSRLVRIGRSGLTYIYKVADLMSDQEEEKAAEKVKADEATVKVDSAGKKFDSYIPNHSAVPGDVIWISSRSGGGYFFRYLILAVHPKKVTCANVFPEGHEAVDLNNPNMIPIGYDPEEAVNLYADLSNICQRRISAFGERCIRVEQCMLLEVKSRLARILEIKDNNEETKELQKKYDALAASTYGFQDENAILKKQLETAISDRDSWEKTCDDLKNKLEQCEKDYELSRDACEILENKLIQANNYASGLQDEIDELKEEHILPEVPAVSNGELEKENAVLKAQVDLYREHISTLEAIIFDLIANKKGVQ